MKADFEIRKKMEEVSTVSGRKIHKSSNKKNRCSSLSSSDSSEKDKAEMKAYLNKLQDLVPFMPKNKKLSKVEVISYVIEYIRELRMTLGLPPCNTSDYPDFEDILMDHSSSPALMMTMTMMKTNVPVEHAAFSSTPSAASILTTSISGAAPASVSPSASVVTAQQQSNLPSSRQPLGVILNPRNCTNGALLPASSTAPIQAFQKSHAS